MCLTFLTFVPATVVSLNFTWSVWEHTNWTSRNFWKQDGLDWSLWPRAGIQPIVVYIRHSGEVLPLQFMNLYNCLQAIPRRVYKAIYILMICICWWRSRDRHLVAHWRHTQQRQWCGGLPARAWTAKRNTIHTLPWIHPVQWLLFML